ncbi:DUF4249 domain-containing protein [Hymenobacter fodinae]|uniref:DUF4249 domain-containing protein n=1 Tax=Hymenobacter fodinae TaxID=2510796 RepID=A0A4Z0PC77_9BACT|nr:DUF4249 domain-containing protein [Hymenobacter fodinae]TGE10245.1 DUF4249 domain-containing protein [Hymenobacter fodinae]
MLQFAPHTAVITAFSHKKVNNILRFTRVALLMSSLVITSCIESFEPKVADAPSSYLVVDGAINSHGITVIKLARTTGLANINKSPAETKARIYLEQEGGNRFLLQESPAGTYTSPVLSLAAEQKVRLHFTTANGREYASDFTPAKITPSVDSITWEAGAQGLQIAVNTHDDTKQSRYYRWSFDETWEFTSMEASIVEYKNKNFVFRLDDIYHCWASENSTAIKLGTTVKLGQNVISQQPLTLLPSNSVKLRYKYSILVRQYALSAEEYSYWEALRKNTENIGTLFDPLPTQLTGNVHNVADASEPVIGFVGAQSVSEKRIFITHSQLPREWRSVTGYEMCEHYTIPDPASALPPPSLDEIFAFFETGMPTPISSYKANGLLYVVYATSDCVDCRKRGTNVRPSFWQ